MPVNEGNEWIKKHLSTLSPLRFKQRKIEKFRLKQYNNKGYAQFHNLYY